MGIRDNQSKRLIEIENGYENMTNEERKYALDLYKEVIQKAKDISINDRTIIQDLIDRCDRNMNNKNLEKEYRDISAEEFKELSRMMREITKENNNNFINISKDTLKGVVLGLGGIAGATLLGIILNNNKNQQTNEVIEADYKELAIEEEI